MRDTRDRIKVYGSAAVVVLALGCYGWHPIASTGAGLAVALVVAWWLDGRPPA